MEGLEGRVDRLYELYQEHFRELLDDVIAVNLTLGSTQPRKTWMELLDRTSFETLIATPIDDPELVGRWIRCIVRGHEDEFPELRVA